MILLEKFRTILQTYKEVIYSPSDINAILMSLGDIKKKHCKKYNRDTGNSYKVDYLNIPISFDTETSSFKIDEVKHATMYVWTCNFGGYNILGRTWDEFINMIETVQKWYDLETNKTHLIVYCHNLSFDFQFFRKYFRFTDLFALDTRKPIYAITNGIEFRCSYILSGYSLERLAKNLNTFTVSKLVGYLNYDEIRHTKTKLTEKEQQYAIEDVRIVTMFIIEEIERNSNNITKIPLTKTGYVRRYCREKCFGTNDWKKSIQRKQYQKLISSLTIDPIEYLQLKRAFSGGYTHASPIHADTILEKVSSYDLTSAYPYFCVSQRFPMSKAEIVEINNKDEFYENMNKYCCIFDVYFENIQSTFPYDNYISTSHCYELKNSRANNGRLISCDSCILTVTEVDFKIIEKTYKWDKIKIANFRRYKKGYLPPKLVEAILDLYEKKTTLKQVDGKEQEYMNSKENLNSCYGMMVTDIIQEIIKWINNEWGEKQFKSNDYIREKINEYNTSKNRFLFYPWGIYVTAYCRRTIWEAIIHLKSDYVYTDTDSIKMLNGDKHKEYFEEYNRKVYNLLKYVMTVQNIPFEKCNPKTIEGVEKLIGVFDYEGTYERAKFLQAKRYLVEEDGELIMTVSGLNKKVTVPYLLKKYKTNTNVFNAFTDGLCVPSDNTGKLTHTYIDEEQICCITDYLGNKSEIHELSCIHLEKAPYRMNMTEDYIQYISQFRER